MEQIIFDEDFEKMRRKSRFWLALLFALLLTAAVPVTWLSQASGIMNEASAASVKLNYTKKNVTAKKSFTLRLKGTSKTAKWSVPKKYAKILRIKKKGKNEYKVTGLKAGVGYVQAKISGKTYKCKVTVKGAESVRESSQYTSKAKVAEYLNKFGHLPDNYITKKEAQKLGWDSSTGNLWDVAPGKSIGGDYFGNYEGRLPEADGRDYYECDIDYTGGSRGGKRIVYSNDGLIYYTEDHYQSFVRLY